MAEHAASDHGRGAERPRDVPGRGWKDILWRVKEDATKDNLSMIAGGVAFYALLALPAMLASVVSIYGMVASPEMVQRQVQGLAQVLPPDAANLVGQQLAMVSEQTGGTLGLSLAISLGIALWSTSKAMLAVMTALNIAYHEEEKRGTVRLYAVALGLTLVAIVYLIVALALVAAIPAVLNMVPVPDWMRWVIQLARWPILFGLALAALAALYRYAPSRAQPQWRWVSAGGIVGTALWVLGSIAFSVYVTNFGNYNETYGTLGAVVILMMWLFISAYAVLIGAEVNSELERQTERDTTDRQRPMGERGAYSADTLGDEKA